MPQLMPLGWVFSIFMVMYLLIMGLSLYYKSDKVFSETSVGCFSECVYWLW